MTGEKEPRTLASYAAEVAARERPRAHLPAAVVEDQHAPVARVVPKGARKKKVGKAVLGYMHRPTRKLSTWTRNAQRLAEGERLIQFRAHMATDHGQLFDVREEDYLTAFLPELILEQGMPNRPLNRANAITWATRHLPTLLDRRDLEWFDGLEAEFVRLHRRLRPLRADAVAKLLQVTWDERQECGLTTIGAIDMDKRQRGRERKKAHAARGRVRRVQSGATPRAESLAQVKPWEQEGLSRAAWYRLRKASETISCAPYCFHSRPVTNLSQASVVAIDVGLRALARWNSVDTRQLTLLAPSQERAELEAACAGWPVSPTDENPAPEHPNEMPDEIRAAYIAAKRRRAMSQGAIANVIGISRPQLANAINAKRRRAESLPNAFDLSPEIIENLKKWLLAGDAPREPEAIGPKKPAGPHHRRGGKRPLPDPTPPLPGLRLFSSVDGDGERRQEPDRDVEGEAA